MRKTKVAARRERPHETRERLIKSLVGDFFEKSRLCNLSQEAKVDLQIHLWRVLRAIRSFPPDTRLMAPGDRTVAICWDNGDDHREIRVSGGGYITTNSWRHHRSGRAAAKACALDKRED